MIAFCSSLKIGRGLWLFGAFSTTSPSEKRRDTTPRYHLEVSRGSVWAWNRPCHCLVFFSKRRPPLTEKCFSQHRPVWLHFLSLSSATHVAIRPTKWPPVHRWSPNNCRWWTGLSLLVALGFRERRPGERAERTSAWHTSGNKSSTAVTWAWN